MASAKRKASKAKKAKRPAARKPAAAKPKVVVRPDPKTLHALREAKKEAERQQREAAKLRALLQRDESRIKALEKAVADQKLGAKAIEAQKRAYEKQVEAEKKAAAKDAERQRREAEKRAEQERKAAEKAAIQQKKAEEKAAAQAAALAAKTQKKRPIPTTSLAATPIIRPLSGEAPPLAPPPPPAKPGHADHQVVSALSYGLFAAVNKTFGFAGQTVVKNAALRMLEYGYKRGWLPPKSKEPVRALNEFFGRLETMGYAERIHVGKRGEHYVLEVQGLADFDAVHELRSMHYPLLPIFLGEMLSAIVDQYFHLRVTMEPIEFQESKRGFNLGFSIHEPTATPEISRLQTYSRMDDFEE